MLSGEWYYTHLSLYAFNVLVTTGSQNTLVVTGLLDRDLQYACFCPKCFVLRPLSWMQDDEEHQSDVLASALIPLTSQFQEVKQLFEELAGEEWLRHAYSQECWIARWIFDILKYGISGKND